MDAHMVNKEFDPSDTEEAVIEVMREENRANPYLLREETGLGKGTINTALTRLTSAGWVRKVTRGLYEFVDDPRTDQQGATDVSDSPPAPAVADPEIDTDIEAAMRELVADRPPQTNHGKEAVILTMQILREDGPLSTSETQEAVYERLGSDEYDSARGMWQSIQRYLGDVDDPVPGIEKVGYGEWDYAGDDVLWAVTGES